MGRDCTHSPDANSGILIVRHSQSAKNPECVFPNTLLWAGYSLSYNAYSHDLGSPSSCFKTLSMQAVSCDGIHQKDTNSVCSFVSNYNRTIWLPVTDDDIPNKINKKELGKYVSRCVVCEMPLNFIVVHSQTRNEAICPTNWAEIWRGYSFFTVSCFYCDAFGQKKNVFFYLLKSASQLFVFHHFSVQKPVESFSKTYKELDLVWKSSKRINSLNATPQLMNATLAQVRIVFHCLRLMKIRKNSMYPIQQVWKCYRNVKFAWDNPCPVMMNQHQLPQNKRLHWAHKLINVIIWLKLKFLSNIVYLV